mgnify:CR=1 FL=1
MVNIQSRLSYILKGGAQLRLNFKNYDDYYSKCNNYSSHECSECKGTKEVAISEVTVNIADRIMNFEDIPVLKCTSCGAVSLADHSKKMIDECYKYMIKENHLEGNHKYNGYRKKIEYCQEDDLIYDHRDYYSIPRLSVDFEHSKEGFLTPVYFTKKSILHFMHDPDYEFKLFSDTYGQVGYKDEWIVPFGINSEDKIIFWLGDLSYMDKTSLNILKPHNIESDHQLTRSEFYAAQLCCVWSEPNKELRVCYKKCDFYNAVRKAYHLSLEHLESEIKEQMNRFQKPIVISEKTIEPTINMLHKVLIEGVNIKELRNLYLKVEVSPADGYKDWKSIKLYEAILKALMKGNIEKLDITSIIGPLYLLNDLRQYYDHLLSNEKRNEIKENIIKTFDLESFEEIDSLYEQLIDGLNMLFEYFILATNNQSLD